MKKKRSLVYLMIATIVSLLTFAFTACDKGEQSTQSSEKQNAYSIQYSDGNGIIKQDVIIGETFSLSKIPQKEGYTFIGLFDAEDGGTQYTNAQGISLSVFVDRQNLVLFPHFEAKTFSIVFDYEGAEQVDNTLEAEVTYGNSIADGEIPMNLYKENMVFVGWFTEPNGQGKQITNATSVNASKSKVTAANFDVSSDEINLYAFFELEKYDVTIVLKDGSVISKKVEYGTDLLSLDIPVSDGCIVGYSTQSCSDTALEYGLHKTISEPMTVYAILGRSLSFDSIGGSAVNKIYGIEGQEVSLPIPTRYKYDTFAGWEYNGNTYMDTMQIPNKSITLTAKWDTNDWTYISNANEFLKISNNLNGKYCLTNDIDLGSYKPRDSYAWSASSDTKYKSLPNGFTGQLDGQGYSITYTTYIDEYGNDCAIDSGWGLFACARNANFKDLKIMANIGGAEHVTGNKWMFRTYIGGVVGWAVNCSFENISVSGSLRQQQSSQLAGTAGVAGYGRNCSFTNCSNSATIYSGGRYVPVAGICAGNVSSNYTNCSNSGSLTASRGNWVKIGGAWTEIGDIYIDRL